MVSEIAPTATVCVSLVNTTPTGADCATAKKAKKNKKLKTNRFMFSAPAGDRRGERAPPLREREVVRMVKGEDFVAHSPTLPSVHLEVRTFRFPLQLSRAKRNRSWAERSFVQAIGAKSVVGEGVAKRVGRSGAVAP